MATYQVGWSQTRMNHTSCKMDHKFSNNLRQYLRHLINGYVKELESTLSGPMTVCPKDVVNVVFNYFFDDFSQLTPFVTAMHYGYLPLILQTWYHNEMELTHSGIRPLLLAAQLGHYLTVRMFMESGANIEEKNKFGDTPLGIACIHGHHKVVAELLKTNRTLNTRHCTSTDSSLSGDRSLYSVSAHYAVYKNWGNQAAFLQHGESALFAACKNGHIECARLLLDFCGNADLNMNGHSGYSPLFVAAQNNHVQVVQLLLDHNADINCVSTKNKRTALWTAASCGHCEIVKLLLSQSNLNINHQDKFKETALYAASENGHSDVVKMLLSRDLSIGHPANPSIESTPSPLCIAASRNHVECMRHFIECGADIEQRGGSFGETETPLMIACNKAHYDAVELLLEANANIDVVDEYGNTPLMTTMTLEDLSIFQLILLKGADPHITNEKGLNVVMIIAKRGHIEKMKMLYEYFAANWIRRQIEALFNAGDCKKGLTPLHFASKKGYENVVRYLVETVKVNTLRRNKRDQSARDLATTNGYRSIASWLSEQEDLCLTEYDSKIQYHSRLFIAGYCKRAESLMTGPLCHCSNEIMALIFEYFCDDSPEIREKTPFMKAFRLGYFSLTKELWPSFKGNFIGYGSAAKKAMERGHTPLWTAARKGNVETVLVFLCGPTDVDIDCKDENGITPLWIATRNGHSKVVELLLNPPRDDVNGADPKILSDDGTTALWVAASLGNVECLKYLIASGADIDGPNESTGATSLFIAAQNGHKQVVNMLIAAGADINAPRTIDGTTPLMAAASNGRKEITRILLENQADPMMVNKAGVNLFGAAAMMGHLDVIRLLVEHKVHLNDVDFVNATNKNGRTPMHFACQYGHENVVRYLAETFKVAVNQKDRYNKTPKDLAVENGHESIIKWMGTRKWEFSKTFLVMDR